MSFNKEEHYENYHLGIIIFHERHNRIGGEERREACSHREALRRTSHKENMHLGITNCVVEGREFSPCIHPCVHLH